MPKIRLVDGVYMFDAMDGTEATACKVWIETSKKNEKHPDGKPWIVLPKGNISNRTYFSEELFNETNVDGEVSVEIKVSAPRVLGTSGVKQTVVKYLDEATGAEYTELVNSAVEAYKEAKSTTKKVRIEDMTADELQAYIDALKSGKKASIAKIGPKSFIDMFTEDQYNRYNELLALAAENKANMPKAKRGPLSDDEKKARRIKRTEKQISKAEALLAALKAGTTSDEDDLSDLISDEE